MTLIITIFMQWDDNTTAMMTAAVLVIVNTNTAIMNCILLAHEEQWEQELHHLMYKILMPSQVYRYQPRRP